MYRIFVVLIIFLFSCKSSSVFNKNFHEEYGKKLIRAGLEQTALGKHWFQSADLAIKQPFAIDLPYKEKGYFQVEKPRAVGLKFTGKRGQKIIIQLQKNPSAGFTIYTDLWELDLSNKTSLITSFDTLKNSYEYEVEKDVLLLLRFQPELLKSGDYNLSISIGPSIAFPVSGKVGRIGSFWGDNRDGGSRSHEGIDIFAPKRTPVIAAADGRVSSVRENELGGKVVFMKPTGKNYTLYYAHLDEQLVTDGQKLNKGDTIGLVGNTGNARTTPPHLHFGIYSFGGAIDPLPFVYPVIKSGLEPEWSHAQMKQFYRLKSIQTLKTPGGESATIYPEHTVVRPLSNNSSMLIVELPGGEFSLVDSRYIEKVQNSLKRSKTTVQMNLLDAPELNASRKILIDPGTTVSIHGYFNEFAFLKVNEMEGWVEKSLLK